MFAVIDQNKQQRTDSEGFLTGAYYSMAQKVVFAATYKSASQYNSPEIVRSSRATAGTCFNEFRKMQHQLGLSDEDVVTALGAKDADGRKRLVEVMQKTEQQIADLKNQSASEEAVIASKKKAEAAAAAQQAQVNGEQRELEARKAAQEQVHQAEIKANLPRLVKESQVRAVKKYPRLAVSGSPENAKFVAAVRRLQAEESLRLQEPDWPEKLADECATKP